MVEIIQAFAQLVTTLLTLILAIGALAVQHVLLIAWVAWWLGGVNWTRAWSALANGGWVVLALLTVLAALVWAALAPGSYDCLGLFSINNFWWQLGAVVSVVLLALFCGWLQGVFGWAPAEIELAPAVAGHEDHLGAAHH